MIRVTFSAPHTHAGQALKPGDVAHVPDLIAQWLVQHRIASVSPETEPVKPRQTARTPSHSPATPSEGK